MEAGNLLFDGDLEPGDTFVIDAATLGERDLGAKVGFYLDSAFVAEVHTSCSDVLGVGTTEANQEKGQDPNGAVDVEVTGGVGKDGVAYCDIPPPPPPGSNCVECGYGAFDGAKAAMLTLRYSGAPGRVTVYRSNKVEAGNLLFDGDLEPGDTFVIDAATLGERDLGAKVGFYLDGEFIAEIHTSCSDVLTVGTTEANQEKGKDPNGVVDVTVTAGRDKNGGIYCGEEPCPDAGPPTIEYSVVEEGGMYFVEVRVSDDVAIADVVLEEEGTGNLEEVLSARMFTPGETSAYFKFKILDPQLDAVLKGRATDACGNTLCPVGDENAAPDLTPTLVLIDDETGNVVPASEVSGNPRNAGFDRYGQLVEGSDDGGITRYQVFALDNMVVFDQPIADCDAEAGCELEPPAQNISFIAAIGGDGRDPGNFGLLLADECSVYVLDPATPGNARVAGSTYSCPGLAATASLGAEEGLSFEFELEQNRPNPFQGRSVVQFSMPASGDVHLTVIDMLGRTVRTLAEGEFSEGRHTVAIDASTLPSGTYLYRLTTEHGTAVKQMIVTR